MIRQPDYLFVTEIPRINLGSIEISTLEAVELTIDLKPSTPFREFDPLFPMAPVREGLGLDYFRVGHDSCGRELIEIKTIGGTSDPIEVEANLFGCQIECSGSECTVRILRSTFANTEELAKRIGFIREALSCLLTFMLDIYVSVFVTGAQDQSGHALQIQFPPNVRIGAYDKAFTEKCFKKINEVKFTVPEVGVALHYYWKARKLAQVFYSTEFLPEQFLNYCKAIAVLLGDKHSTNVFKKRCQQFGISDEERVNRIEPIYEKRNDWDVAHRIDLTSEKVKRVLVQDTNEAQAVAKDVMSRFINAS